MKVSKKEIQLRQENIIHFLQAHTFCETNALASQFQVSLATIRRDIQDLEKEGLVVRHHGGVQIARPFNENIPYEIYSVRNQAEKEHIVKYVAENLIVEKEVIFINSSSTALLIYPYINKPVTIVTNNAKVLKHTVNPMIHFILIGGELSSHNGEHILCGEFALSMISSITASTCILGTSGISAGEGMTSSSPQDVSINKMMLSRTKGKKIIVADSSKIGEIFAFNYGQIQDITHLVTDNNANPNELEKMKKLGISVITVPVYN